MSGRWSETQSATAPKEKSGKLIIIAWSIEIAAICMGLILAIYAGIEGSDAGFLKAIMALMPFAALSFIEGSKIPFAELFFKVKRLRWKALALLAICAVTVASWENFVFGFERGFNERVRAVEIAEQTVRRQEADRDIAKTRLPQLTAQQAELTSQSTAIRQEIGAIRAQAQQDIEDSRRSDASSGIRADRERLEAERQRLERERDAAIQRVQRACGVDQRNCPITATRNRYNADIATTNRQVELLRTQATEEREGAQQAVEKARAKRDADLSAKEAAASAVQQQLDITRQQMVEAQLVLLTSEDNLIAANRTLNERLDASQVHRISLAMLGSRDPHDVETVKRFFVMSLAAIVATIGTLLAMIHYAARSEATSVKRTPLANVFRAYLARRRRRLPLMVNIHNDIRNSKGMIRSIRGILARRRRTMLPIVKVEVPKEVLVERVKLVFLPLDATEAQIAEARREAKQAAAA